MIIGIGAVVATAVVAGIARVARADLLEGCAVHSPDTEHGCAVRTGQTPIDPWGDFSSGRWLWFLNDVQGLQEPVPAVGRQSLWRWDAGDQRWCPTPEKRSRINVRFWAKWGFDIPIRS